MRQRMSDKSPDAVTVVRHYAPDLVRQAQALLAVLRVRETHQRANEGTAEEGGQRDAQKQQTPMGQP